MNSPLFEISTQPHKDTREYEILRVERGEQWAEGRYLVSVVNPVTSNGARIVLEPAQLKELANQINYLLANPQ